jgi:hypothetical protein
VEHTLLRRIVEQEGTSFQQIEHFWRPQNLLMSAQVRVLIHDIERRFERLSEAEGELETLDRADKYIKLLRRMRLDVRTATFTWKANQLRFIQAVTQFYSDFGAVLRLLKQDQQRGLLADQPS